MDDITFEEREALHSFRSVRVKLILKFVESVKNSFPDDVNVTFIKHHSKYPVINSINIPYISLESHTSEKLFFGLYLSNLVKISESKSDHHSKWYLVVKGEKLSKILIRHHFPIENAISILSS